MITTSDKYKTAIIQIWPPLPAENRHCRYCVYWHKELKLKGGTNSSEQITFGDAVSSYIEFILTDVPKNTILKGRQAIPYIGLELDDGTVEWIKKGVYTLKSRYALGVYKAYRI